MPYQIMLTTITHHIQRNGLEVSLGMLPPDHPFLDPRQLEAEATGLLDRMLGVLQDNIRYDNYYGRRPLSNSLLT